MSIIKQDYGEIGGGLNEGEIIYENANPSTSLAGQTLNLISGKKFSNYNYLKFVYNISTTVTTQNKIIIESSLFQTYAQGGTNLSIAMSAYNNGSYYWRRLNYGSDTSFVIGQGNDASGNQSNAQIILVAVYGIN